MFTDVWLWSMVFVTLVVVGTIAAISPAGASLFAPFLALLSAVTPPLPAPVAAALPRVEQMAQAIVPASQSCRVVQGFAMLEAYVGQKVIGSCLEDERFDPATATSAQATTGGLLVWRKADGTLAFTDGYRTWLLGPSGQQQRLNSQRYCWESDASPGQCLPSAARRA